MGLIAKTIPSPSAIRNADPAVISSPFTNAMPLSGAGYLGFSGAYMRNEIVFAAIEMLATSAGEPEITGYRQRRSSPQIRAKERSLIRNGVPNWYVPNILMENGYTEELLNHPEVKLLNNPNPFMSRSQMMGTLVMDESLAGNWYLYKARGPLGNIGELWRLRPDRVRVIPRSDRKGIDGYEYRVGREVQEFPAADVIHYKRRHPLDDLYGMPPLMAIAGRVDIDDYMKNFLKTFFERGGAGIGGVLAIKNALNQQQRDGVRDLLESRTAGPANWHKWLVLDATEATYTPAGLNRGLRDALPKELDAVSEARMAMVFGVPGSMLGLLIGYESSSYANKRQDDQWFWDSTMTPKLVDYQGTFNLFLTPGFGGIDKVAFDFSTIRALQEDTDKIHKRHRDNVFGSLESWQEGRDGLGLDPSPKSGTFFIPANMVAVDFGSLDEPTPPAAPALPPATVVEAIRATFTPPQPLLTEAKVITIVEEAHCECGRLLGKNLNEGGEVWCARCKKDVAIKA